MNDITLWRMGTAIFVHGDTGGRIHSLGLSRLGTLLGEARHWGAGYARSPLRLYYTSICMWRYCLVDIGKRVFRCVDENIPILHHGIIKNFSTLLFLCFKPMVLYAVSAPKTSNRDIPMYHMRDDESYRETGSKYRRKTLSALLSLSFGSRIFRWIFSFSSLAKVVVCWLLLLIFNFTTFVFVVQNAIPWVLSTRSWELGVRERLDVAVTYRIALGYRFPTSDVAFILVSVPCVSLTLLFLLLLLCFFLHFHPASICLNISTLFSYI